MKTINKMDLVAVDSSPPTLNEKQRAFITEYLIDLNATQAALRAGYSSRSARSIAAEHMSKPHIRSAIAMALKARELRTEVTQDRVVQELARIAFLDPRQLFDANGKLRPIDKVDASVAAGIAAYDVVSGQGGVQMHRVRFGDKIAALDKLAKHLGMYEIDNKQQRSPLAQEMASLLESIHSTGSRLPLKIRSV